MLVKERQYQHLYTIMFEMLDQMLYGIYAGDTLSIDCIASFTYDDLATCLDDDSAYGSYLFPTAVLRTSN
jgi:hypothetical protein